MACERKARGGEATENSEQPHLGMCVLTPQSGRLVPERNNQCGVKDGMHATIHVIIHLVATCKYASKSAHKTLTKYNHVHAESAMHVVLFEVERKFHV